MAGAPNWHVKIVGEEFFAHRLLNPGDFRVGSVLPWPLNMEEYVRDQPWHQIDLCAQLAGVYVNKMLMETHPDGPRLEHVSGVHGNMFILRHDDPLNYFHVYFKGSFGNEKVRFFAELCGEVEPKYVRSCTPVDKTTGSLVNCKYCLGGLRHPPGGGFTGYDATVL